MATNNASVQNNGEFLLDNILCTVDPVLIRRYFQHAHFIPIVGVGKRGEY